MVGGPGCASESSVLLVLSAASCKDPVAPELSEGPAQGRGRDTMFQCHAAKTQCAQRHLASQSASTGVHACNKYSCKDRG